MTVATVDKDGQPFQRIVLLKNVDQQGFVFYTNLGSRKAQQLEHNSKISLHFPWHPLERQVHITGTAEKLSAADELLRQQLQGKLGPDLLANSSYLIDELKAGRINEQVPGPLKVLFRPSVQPYLISLFRHDPATAMAATRCPTLIIQGSRDAQVSLADASALHAARPEAELAVIAGMNHVLRIVAPDSPAPLASYNEPQLPLAHELLVRIETFLLDTGLLPSSR